MKTQNFKGIVLTKTKVKNNILRIWNLTNKYDRFDWYQEANDWASNRVVEGVNLNKVCGIIAALSPVKRWEDNLKCAVSLINTRDCGHMKQFKNKALAILDCDGSEEEILKILNGNKISAFYKNIRHPFDGSNVTIDRHALSIALGYWITEDDYKGMTTNQYNFFSDCFAEASLKVGVSPLLMQSATWVKWREIKTEYKRTA